jgi:hypothetical protein
LHLRELIQHHATRHPARDTDVEFCHHFSAVARLAAAGRFEEAAAALTQFDWAGAGLEVVTTRLGRYDDATGRRQQQPLPFVLNRPRLATAATTSGRKAGADAAAAPWSGLHSTSMIDDPRNQLLAQSVTSGVVATSTRLPGCGDGDDHDDDGASVASLHTTAQSPPTAAHDGDGLGAVHTVVEGQATTTTGVVTVPSEPSFDARESMEHLQLVIAHGLFGVF